MTMTMHQFRIEIEMLKWKFHSETKKNTLTQDTSFLNLAIKYVYIFIVARLFFICAFVIRHYHSAITVKNQMDAE